LRPRHTAGPGPGPGPGFRRAAARGLLALATGLLALGAGAQERFVFMTNWYAQAEHGGFYQAQARGLYRAAGLDVTLRVGGPQTNGMQLLAAGQIDCFMGYDVQTMKAWEQGIPVVTVAAAFQKDAAVLIAHPGVVDRLEDLKGKTLLIGAASHQSFWPWLRATYGLQDSQLRPYTFNIQPFLANRNVVQQGYFSSEPYAIEKEAGFKPRVFLLADHGWPPYATSIVCMEKTVRERPKAVAAFVKASMQGWRSYLLEDPAPANALIKRDNPQMTDDRIEVARRLMKESGMVLGGDAARLGIGVITDERMKRTYDMLVAMKLLDPKKVDLKRTYTTQFVRENRVMP
jgi:NitT/TauT family transport system substrate-binding protein